MNITGLDIGSRSAKAVQVALEGPTWRVRRAESETYPQPSYSTDPAGRARLVAHVRALLGRLGDPGYLITAIPRHKAVLKAIEMPGASEPEFARMVEFEAGRHLPVPVEEVRLDYEIITPAGPARPRAEVLLVAVRWSDLDRHLALVRDAGRLPDQIDVSALALAAAFLGTRGGGARAPGGPVALVDMGGQAVEIVVVGHGGAPASRRVLVMAEGAQRVVDEVRQTLRGFAAEVRGLRVERVLLCGGGRTPDLAAALGETLGLPVEPFDPFADWSDMAGTVPAEERGLYAVAVGLALRGVAAQIAGPGAVVNLLPPDLAARARSRRTRRRRMLAAAGVAGLLVAVWIAASWGRLSAAQALRRLEARAREEGPAMTEVRWLMDRLEAVRPYTEGRGLVLDLLREVSVRAPGGITLSSLVFEADRPLLLRGRAVSYATVSQFLIELGRSPRFRAVASRGLREQSAEGQTWVEFEISAPLAGAP